jgi:CubicO group peptidase (beta-lactamase class C family)
MSYKLRTICLKFSSLLVFLLILQFASAQRKNDKEYGTEAFAGLNSYLTRQQKALGTDLVAVVWRDTLVFKKELGDFNVKAEAPLASASKWLTAALILVLVDEGKLSLDDKVSDFLPIYSRYGKNYITLRHCLTHFTGIQSNGKLFDGKIESLEDEAASFAKREIQTNPGTEFRYSNIGFFLAGRVAEVVTKKKFDQLIKQKLLNPLGMSRTSFSTLDGSGVNPADGARSTALDYMKFLAMLLNKGKHNGRQILSEEAVKEIRKIHTNAELIRFAPKAVNGLNYAMGSWVYEEQAGEATALAGTSLFGALPVVDWCRGYALLLLPKELQAEQKTDALQPIKAAVDEAVRNRCLEK